MFKDKVNECLDAFTEILENDKYDFDNVKVVITRGEDVAECEFSETAGEVESLKDGEGVSVKDILDKHDVKTDDMALNLAQDTLLKGVVVKENGKVLIKVPLKDFLGTCDEYNRMTRESRSLAEKILSLGKSRKD